MTDYRRTHEDELRASRSSNYGDYRDDRGSRWESGAEERYSFDGSTGLYRTDDRAYHDRYRDRVERHDRAVKDDRYERDAAAHDYYRAAREQRDDYLRWSTPHGSAWGEHSIVERDEPLAWGPRERGGYWRHYESHHPNFVGRGPRGYQRSDDRIRDEICDRMTDDPMLDASDISVEVRQGEVLLTGTVTSRDQKRRADDLIDRVSGVKDVTNQLRVMRNGQGHETLNETPSKSTSSSTT